ncbi:MAG: hypothetical protein P4L40_17635, partial [Terracidiphilus sp.]|nr:hypothetical protein [Terracidiphilus sp.]
MTTNYPVLLVLCAALSLSAPATLRALDDTTAKTAATEKPAEKAADKPALPPDVTTQGEVNAGGQHIAYNAIAGTITVGATDVQDAQLGLDGKPQSGSQLALAEPKD